MKLLQDKVALITGGSRGIGAALVARFVEHGAHVAFTYRSSAAEAEKVIAENTFPGITIKAYQSDASNFNAAETLVSQIVEDFGKLDILVNNAGITQDTLLLRMTEEQWDKVIETNLKSVFNLCKQVLKPMMKAKNGVIINMGSIVGVTGNAGQANYAASKAGIIGFTKSLAKEMGARNIRCNTVAPGFIETDMTDELDDKTREAYLSNIPLKRFGKPAEIAEVCVFLSSDMGAYISGQTISVCGALTT
ncbi:MAG: 3-oxoacyl-[acyl-carrier-protein] reductase [Bacteroidota bacterium]